MQIDILFVYESSILATIIHLPKYKQNHYKFDYASHGGNLETFLFLQQFYVAGIIVFLPLDQ